MTLLLLLYLLLMPAQPHVVTVSAKKFSFTPAELTLKRGETVTIRETSEDRAHGLFQKELGIELDAKPGSPDEVTITPAKPGRYVAICDHFCGSGHGNMKMVITVQ